MRFGGGFQMPCVQSRPQFNDIQILGVCRDWINITLTFDGREVCKYLSGMVLDIKDGEGIDNFDQLYRFGE